MGEPRNLDLSHRPRNLDLSHGPRNLDLSHGPRNLDLSHGPRNLDLSHEPRNLDPSREPRNLEVRKPDLIKSLLNLERRIHAPGHKIRNHEKGNEVGLVRARRLILH